VSVKATDASRAIPPNGKPRVLIDTVVDPLEMAKQAGMTGCGQPRERKPAFDLNGQVEPLKALWSLTPPNYTAFVIVRALVGDGSRPPKSARAH